MAVVLASLVAIAALVLAALLYVDRRAIAQRLKDTKQISDLGNDPVLVGDINDGKILYANKAFRGLIGAGDEAALGSLRIPDLHPPELVGRSAERIAEVWETKGLIYSDLPLKHASGELIDVELSANLVDYGGQRAILLYARDIRDRLKHERAIQDHATEMERINKDLRDTQAQLVQSEKLASLGTLAAGVAHEMNSPIGAMRGNADVGARALVIVSEAIGKTETSNPKLQRALSALRDTCEGNKTAVERISGIVRSLQSFARLDEAERKPVDLHEGIESALTLLRPQLTERIEVARELGELPMIECFPGRLNQVFMNLLTNAVAAIEGPGTITVRTRVAGDQVELAFIDTGKGMPKEQLERLFDPSFRSGGGRVRAGFGLPLAFAIVSEHGGSIDVASELGKGSTFTVRLPIVKRSGVS